MAFEAINLRLWELTNSLVTSQSSYGRPSCPSCSAIYFRFFFVLSKATSCNDNICLIVARRKKSDDEDDDDDHFPLPPSSLYLSVNKQQQNPKIVFSGKKNSARVNKLLDGKHLWFLTSSRDLFALFFCLLSTNIFQKEKYNWYKHEVFIRQTLKNFAAGGRGKREISVIDTLKCN